MSEMLIMWRLQRATHQIGIWIEASLKDEGITQGEAHILAYLATTTGSSMNELHHLFGHRRSTLTNIVDRLESRGLVRRSVNPASRRSVMLSLTQSGESLGSEVFELIHWMDQSVRDRVTPEELRGFERVTATLMEVAS
jgi:DNA-binding MarR family transcriptional regulator